MEAKGKDSCVLCYMIKGFPKYTSGSEVAFFSLKSPLSRWHKVATSPLAGVT